MPDRLVLGRFRCTGPHPVPSLRVGKGLAQEGERQVRSQPDVTRSDKSRNAGTSNAKVNVGCSPPRRLRR